jgi:hypothetical protein
MTSWGVLIKEGTIISLTTTIRLMRWQRLTKEEVAMGEGTVTNRLIQEVRDSSSTILRDRNATFKAEMITIKWRETGIRWAGMEIRTVKTKKKLVFTTLNSSSFILLSQYSVKIHKCNTRDK